MKFKKMSIQNMITSVNNEIQALDSLAVDTCFALNSDPLISQMLTNNTLLSESSGFVISAPDQAWIFYFFIILITGYAVARAFLGQLLSSTFYSVLRYNTALSMFKDNSQLQRQRDNALHALYFITTGFFLMLLAQDLNLHPYGFAGFRLFIFLSLVVPGFFYLRIMLLNLLGVVFYNRNLYREYLYLSYSYNKLIGIILLPLNFILVYTTGTLREVFMIFTLVALGVLLILKVFRALQFSIKHNVFNFYLFLYLCALEIVPILLIYKWFQIIV
jgi:hypothetical protein